MPLLQFGAGSYDNTENGFPVVKLENWFAEVAPERTDANIKLLPTPGLSSFATGLSGPVDAMFQRDGHQSGKIIAEAGGVAYAIDAGGVAVGLGAIGVDAFGARFDASDAQVVVSSNGVASYLDIAGTQFIPINTPATGPIIDLCHINNLIVYIEGGSGRFWWSDPLKAQTVSATSFATAESEPDHLLACRERLGDLWLFGSQTIELWSNTGVVTSQFVPRPGGVIERGIIGRRALASADFGIFIVGEDGLVYRIDGLSPTRISTNAIEREISKLTDASKSGIRLESYSQNGHVFIQLSLPSFGVYLYDISTGSWHKRTTYQRNMYSAVSYIRAFGRLFAGDRYSGRINELKDDFFTENGLPVVRLATTGFPVDDGRPAIRSMALDIAAYGRATGNIEPVAELRWSDDFETFSNSITRKLGFIGTTRRAVFGPQGRARMPGRVYELRISDNLGVALIGVKLNVRQP